MKSSRQIDNIETDVSEYVDSLFFSVSGVPNAEGNPIINREEYVLKLVTRFAVSLCTAWLTLTEFLEYVSKRKFYQEMMSNE